MMVSSDSELYSGDLTGKLNDEKTKLTKHVQNYTSCNSPYTGSIISTNSQLNSSNKTLISNVMNLSKEEILLKNKAEVGPPNWKPTKNSKICSLHLSRNDIAGMGYTRVILRPDAVPRGQSSNNEENEQCNTLLNVKEVFNIENSKTSILTDSIDHNYIDNEAAIKNTFNGIIIYTYQKRSYTPEYKTDSC
ncbi:uncharacterized protein LOC109503911 [Harpegnathos saltator]|uniref:uncharacterized protein LOC109503911 n=1 Tax=Harpegnathos saltator TaxID=610380 RepID=UPI000DBEE887|nr:uncharacterized protein LOC109503911 [Harpegnathos saltator]